jgi:beta-galactosidase
MFHSGLIDTTGATPTLAGREFTDTIEDLERLDPGKIKNTSKNTTEVGLVFDFDQLWHYDILPQAKRWNQSHLLLAWYRALARLGLRIKIIQANQPWPNELPMIVAPGLQMIDEHLLTQMNRYAQSGGNLLLTCRTAWMNRQGQLFEGKIAQPILKLIGGQIEAYDSMPEHIAGQIEMDNEKYHWSIWAELLYNEPTTKILAKYADQFYEDVPAITQNKLASGTVTYCGVYPEQKLLNALVAKLAAQFKLPATPLPDRVHVVRRGKYDILLNYQDKPVSAPAPKDAQFIIGAPKVEPAGIAVWEIE